MKISDDSFNDEMKERLYQWYRDLRFEEIERSCEQYIEEKKIENDEFRKIASNYLS